MKPLTRCKSGHYYDSEKHHACPFCGVPIEEDVKKTVAKKPGASGDEPAVTRKVDHNNSAEKDSAKTVGVYKRKLGIEPVVGWLVAVKGPSRGRDYRITSERNYIGRSETMDISISGDEMISRENHAIISFNPKNSTFHLLPGDSKRLTYLNEEEVLAPELLKSYDHIELGETLLVFVPFCGEPFQWKAEESKE